MPSFCRHNRLIQNCPICSREHEQELQAAVPHATSRTATPRRRPGTATGTRRGPGGSGSRDVSRVSVRRLQRGMDDGYHSPLMPGLRSSAEARALASELSFAAGRLEALSMDPPGLYAEVADPGGDVEERTWLAFLIAYLCPLEDADPFAGIAAARTSWSSAVLPDLSAIATGPRTAHDPANGARTLRAYRAWASRGASQSAAFTGEPDWSPERRFARTFERLSLPGLRRDARFELLVSLGCLGVYYLRAGSLHLGGENPVTIAAKRALGIGDPLLLERRALELSQACKVPLEALDLGLYNWEAAERATMGMGPGAAVPSHVFASVCETLGV